MVNKQFQKVLANGIGVTVSGDMLQLNIASPERIQEFFKAIDIYLNCRPEAPCWLFALSDAINPVPVPERQQPGDAHN